MGLTTITEVQNPLSNITKLQTRGLQAIKEYLRPVDQRLDQDQDHEWDQGRLRENAVQSCEGAPREASGQEGTARGALFFFCAQEISKVLFSTQNIPRN